MNLIKEKILRMNERQINCSTRGRDEGQRGNAGSSDSAANKQEIGEINPHIHVMMKFVFV